MYPEIIHTVVYHQPSSWAAVPANNGGNGPTWQWGDELLVGFTRGTYSDARLGHQCSYDTPFDSWLARSVDGGETWTVARPEPYVSQGLAATSPPGRLDFTGPGFVMRVVGNGYHGNQGAQWFCSEDRGETWRGPYGFGDLLMCQELRELEFTGRTAYLVNSPQDLFLFGSARQRQGANPLDVVYDRAFIARTTDGGGTFSFVSWLVGWDDPYRSVMPAPVRIASKTLVVALRRKSGTANWIDCYVSHDNASMWTFLSKVGKTEDENHFNGNPPALVQMADGRLCCVFGIAAAARSWPCSVMMAGLLGS